MAQLAASVPIEITDTIANYPASARRAFLKLRDIVFSLAAERTEVGVLTESLKWGEPSYVPKRSRTGTPVRIAWKDKAPDSISLFVNCQTTLIQEWREIYGDTFEFVGNRELKLQVSGDWPEAELTHCVAMALTYFVRK